MEIDLPNIDENGNFASTKVLDRLRERFGGGGAILTNLGTSDDALTITTALSTAAVTRVTIPAGATANVATMVAVPAGKTLVVETGATLRRVGTGNGHPVRLNAGSTLTGGGTVDAAGLASYVVSVAGAGATVRGVTLTGSTAYGVGVTGWADTRVEGCAFIGLPSYALLNEGAGATGAQFLGNRVVNGGRGVIMKDCVNSVITGNLLHLTTGVGIEVFGSTSSKCSISGNTVYGTPQIGISLAAATYCTVSGNSVTGCSQLGLENAEGAAHNTFSGNTVGGGAGHGISITSGSGGLKPAHNVSVTGNTVKSMSLMGIATEYGRHISIVGNTILDSGQTPINLNNNATAYVVSNNTVVLTDAGTTGLGIRVAGTSCLIADNMLDFTAKTTQVNTGVRLEGGSRHVLQGNFVRGGTRALSVNNCAGAVLNNNRTEGSTTSSVQFYGMNNTAQLLTHFYTLSGGVVVDNQNATTVTGTLVQVA